MTPDQMDKLIALVLTKYAADLAAAVSDEEFEHFARQAECLFSTDLGDRKRALVDAARARKRALVDAALDILSVL